jgi:3-deoxy-7-phosphoheptulonate synthase
MDSFRDAIAMGQGLPNISIARHRWTGYENVATTHRVTVNGATFGGERPVVIAGPCAIESFEQTLKVAQMVSAHGVKLMRGGAFKPRTNPHDFQGLGHKGLEILAAVKKETGVGIVTEVMDPRLVDQVAQVASMIQIGSRSMHNFPLLTEVGRTSTPVLLKRGWSATLEEWLCAAEYVAMGGNRNIVLCERGIRASCHWSYARNVLDLNVIEPVRRATPLPVIVDPSHSTGQWSLVAAMCRAALAGGAHGLLIEVVASHADRPQLRCDGQQGIPPDILTEIVDEANATRVLDLAPLAPELSHHH